MFTTTGRRNPTAWVCFGLLILQLYRSTDVIFYITLWIRIGTLCGVCVCQSRFLPWWLDLVQCDGVFSVDPLSRPHWEEKGKQEVREKGKRGRKGPLWDLTLFWENPLSHTKVRGQKRRRQERRGRRGEDTKGEKVFAHIFNLTSFPLLSPFLVFSPCSDSVTHGHRSWPAGQ